MGTRFPNLGRVPRLASPGRARKPLKRRRARRGTPIAARGGGRLDESRAKQYVRCPPPGEGGPARAPPPLIFFHPSLYLNRVVPPQKFLRVFRHFPPGGTILSRPEPAGPRDRLHP